MRRWIIALLACALLGGCIRIEFDVCEENPMDDNCVVDAGVDAGEADAAEDADGG